MKRVTPYHCGVTAMVGIKSSKRFIQCPTPKEGGDERDLGFDIDQISVTSMALIWAPFKANIELKSGAPDENGVSSGAHFPQSRQKDAKRR